MSELIRVADQSSCLVVRQPGAGKSGAIFETARSLQGGPASADGISSSGCGGQEYCVGFGDEADTFVAVKKWVHDWLFGGDVSNEVVA